MRGWRLVCYLVPFLLCGCSCDGWLDCETAVEVGTVPRHHVCLCTVCDPNASRQQNQVRKNERKALVDKQQDEEWLSYELRAYRARYSQLRDERDSLQVRSLPDLT